MKMDGVNFEVYRQFKVGFIRYFIAVVMTSYSQYQINKLNNKLTL